MEHQRQAVVAKPVDHAWQPHGVIGVPVTEHDRRDVGQVDLQHVQVVEEASSADASIEQHPAPPLPALNFDEDREAMFGDGQRTLECIWAERESLGHLGTIQEQVDAVVGDDRNPHRIGFLQWDRWPGHGILLAVKDASTVPWKTLRGAPITLQ
jgi:hypothetical protein